MVKTKTVTILTSPLLLAAALLLLACQKIPDSTVVPMQSGYLRGVLDNGLRYSVRANDQTKNRMALYLAVNVGSLQEEEDQRGLAHFLEHMAFNGTEHFPGNSLIDFAQQNGMGFGAHLNAYTSFAETVYNFSLPSDDPKLLKDGLNVLYDWLNGMMIDPREVENERGVVLNEWRGSLGFNQDFLNTEIPLLLKGSKFADRLPIGLSEIIQGAPAQRLRDFYEMWYNTDNAMIVMVGDFDAEVMEQQFKKIFSAIAPRGKTRHSMSNGPERENVPVQNEVRAAVLQHEDASARQISVYLKAARLPVSDTVGNLRQNLISMLLQSIAQVRFSDAIKKHSDLVTNIYGFSKQRYGNSEVNQFTVRGQKGKLKQAYQILLQMMAQLKKYGVRQSEMDLALETLRSRLELIYNERNNEINRSLAEYEIEYFLNDSYNIDRAWLYENLDAILAPIRLRQLNGKIEQVLSSEDVSILALGKEPSELPSQQKLIDDYLQIDQLQVAELQDEKPLPKSLMQKLPKPGSITAERVLPLTGFTQWTLSNGLEVYVKSTDFEQNQLQFVASRLGGTFSLKEFAPSSVMGSLLNRVVSASGFSGLSPEEFHRYLLSLKMSNSWNFAPTSTELAGYNDLSDLQELFQQIHLSFTAAQFSQVLIDQGLKNLATEYDNMRNNPNQHTIRLAREHIYQNDARVLLPESLPEQYSSKQLQRAFAQLVPSAKDFTFIFVGSLNNEADKQQFRKYVELYIASLPTEKPFVYRAEDNALSLYEKGQVSEFPLGPQNQSFTIDVWDSYIEPKHFDEQNNYRMSQLSKMLTSLLNVRLSKVLREELSMTYSPRAYVIFRSIPQNRLSVNMYYNSAPADVPKLEETIRQILSDIQAGRINDDDFAKTKQKLQNDREENVQQNSYWRRVLNSALSVGYGDVDTVLSDTYFQQFVESLNKEDLRDFTRYITQDRWSRYTMMPQKED